MTTKIEEIIALGFCSPTGRARCKEPCNECLRKTRGALTSLDAAGLVVVSKEPTDKMMVAGGFSFAGSCPNDQVFPKTRKTWDKMLAAFDPRTWKPAE